MYVFYRINAKFENGFIKTYILLTSPAANGSKRYGDDKDTQVLFNTILTVALSQDQEGAIWRGGLRHSQ